MSTPDGIVVIRDDVIRVTYVVWGESRFWVRDDMPWSLQRDGLVDWVFDVVPGDNGVDFVDDIIAAVERCRG